MDRNDRENLGPNAHPDDESDRSMQGSPNREPQTGTGEGISRESGREGGYGYDRPADIGQGSDMGVGMNADSPIRNDNHVQSNINGTGSNRPNERDRATGTPLDERTGTP